MSEHEYERCTAVEAAARAVLEHGGPECRAAPGGVVAAMDVGASHAEIAAEMRRQRGEH